MLINEAVVRFAFFIGVFTLLAPAEIAVPRRSRSHSRLLRWPSNLLIGAINTGLLRLAFGTAAVGLALAAQGERWGLFNNASVPRWLAMGASVMLLDLGIYLQHVMFHAVPALWRVHRMHHTDLDFDVTTGVRFHPMEVVLSMLIKFALVVTLGTPAAGVMAFEIALNATSTFNHSNLRLPRSLDRFLRWMMVTPDMHRVHHSIVVSELNSNFGFNLPWWDWLLGTYRDQPAAGHEAMIIGVEHFRYPRELRLDRMLLQPFRGGAGLLSERLDKRGLTICGRIHRRATPRNRGVDAHSTQANSTL